MQVAVVLSPYLARESLGNGGKRAGLCSRVSSRQTCGSEQDSIKSQRVKWIFFCPLGIISVSGGWGFKGRAGVVGTWKPVIIWTDINDQSIDSRIDLIIDAGYLARSLLRVMA
jgi:hypothetical protein